MLEINLDIPFQKFLDTIPHLYLKRFIPQTLLRLYVYRYSIHCNL